MGEWIERAKFYPNFPHDQAALVEWYARNETIRRHVGALPWGLRTWHVGGCKKMVRVGLKADRPKGYSFLVPNYIAHVTTRFGGVRMALSGAVIRTLDHDVPRMCGNKSEVGNSQGGVGVGVGVGVRGYAKTCLVPMKCTCPMPCCKCSCRAEPEEPRDRNRTQGRP